MGAAPPRGLSGRYQHGGLRNAAPSSRTRCQVGMAHRELPPLQPSHLLRPQEDGGGDEEGEILHHLPRALHYVRPIRRRHQRTESRTAPPTTHLQNGTKARRDGGAAVV